jgi:hypothetical protein
MSAGDWPGVLSALEDWTAEQFARLTTVADGSPDPAAPRSADAALGPLSAEHAGRAARALHELRRLELALTAARDSTARELQLHTRLVTRPPSTGAVYVDGYG